MEVTADQVVAVLQQRAQTDRLIAEILRAAILEVQTWDHPEDESEESE